MKKLASLAFATLVTLPFVFACALQEDEQHGTGDDAELSMSGEPEAKSTSEALSFCATPGFSSNPGNRCEGMFAGRSSSNSCYMFSAARSALAAANISTSELNQTFGDAAASAGTHCPEPGTSQSAATDIAAGSDPCARVRRLRAQGFAAWYRSPPKFFEHIHAVYAGAPVLKPSLQTQIDHFLEGRNGLVSNSVETACAITSGEIAAVRRVRGGGSAGGGSAGGGTTSTCHAGGQYCGGDKLKGDANTLYRCNPDGSAAFIEKCANGCSVNSAVNDSCK